MDGTKLRAWWSYRQGLDGSLVGHGAAAVLEQAGWARSVGGLGLETFLKPVTVQRVTAAGLERLRPVVEALAAVEGMPAHAAAVQR